LNLLSVCHSHYVSSSSSSSSSWVGGLA